MNKLPIVIVAPTKKEALKAARVLALPYPEKKIVLVGNRSIRTVEGLRADRYHTFFVNIDRINQQIIDDLQHSFMLMDYSSGRV